MSYKDVFKRYEIKYLITNEQFKIIKDAMREHMEQDKYGHSMIYNIYYDTPEMYLVRRSNEKPDYKEKLRVRSYGTAEKDSPVFVEIKKKYDGVVYKRRLSMKEHELSEFMNSEVEKHNFEDGELSIDDVTNHRKAFKNSQIKKEIDYFRSFYEGIAPRVFISYSREAYFSKTDKDFRMTFDSDISYRDYDLTLRKGPEGKKIIGEDKVLLEVKTAMGIPRWLLDIFTEQKIYKTSFSKYGYAYKDMIKVEKLKNTGGINIV